MKRPGSVLINGTRWTITYQGRKAWRRTHGEGCAASSGLTYAADQSIYVLVENISEQNVREVVLHEIMHACLAQSGGTYVLAYVKRANAEEALISTLEPALFAVLRDNPEVLAYLLS